MDWITENVAIGNYVDGEDEALIEREGIRSILCLDCRLAPPPGLKVRRHVVDLVDAPAKQLDAFMKAVQLLERLVAEASPVLVHCHAGRSRSVVLVAALLMRAKGLTPEDAIAFVSKKREAAITPGVEQLLYYI